MTSKVERTRLCVGAQTHKQTCPRICPIAPLLTSVHFTSVPKAISISYSCLHCGPLEYIYDLCVHTYIVRGAYSTLSVYAYSTYDTGQYPPHYYPAAPQSPGCEQGQDHKRVDATILRQIAVGIAVGVMRTCG